MGFRLQMYLKPPLHLPQLDLLGQQFVLEVDVGLGRRFFRGFLAYERDGEHRPDFELTDAIAEQLRLR